MKKRILFTACICACGASALFFRSEEPTIYSAFANSDINEWNNEEVSTVLKKLTTEVAATKKASLKKTQQTIEKQWHDAQQKQLQESAQKGVLSTQGFTPEQIEAATAYAREFAEKHNPFGRLDRVLTEFEKGNWKTKQLFKITEKGFTEDVMKAFSELEVLVIFLKDRFTKTSPDAVAEMITIALSDFSLSVEEIQDPTMREKFTEPLNRLNLLTAKRIALLKKQSK